MKTLIITIISIAISVTSFAQATLSGQVKDAETAEALIFCNLTLSKGKNHITTLSDIDGHYQFKKLSPGAYRLEVSYTGYQFIIIEEVIIKRGQSNQLDIQLKPGVVLDELVVVGAKGSKKEKSTTSGKVLSAEDIRKLPTKNIHALAGKTAGISIADSGDGKGKKKKKSKAGGGPKIMIRGSRPEPTDHYINGVIVMGDLVSEEKERPDLPSSQLTAGEWSDLDNWETWKEIIEEDFSHYAEEWKIRPTDRYSVMVQANGNRPLPNLKIQLLENSGKVIWETYTDNKGKAELWSNLFEKDKKAVKIVAEYKDKQVNIDAPKNHASGVNTISFPVGCVGANSADVCFVVDATSSMSDEIYYLQAEMEDVINRIQQDNPKRLIRTGSVFYRDLKDSYLTKSSPLSENHQQTLNFLLDQHAAGGGDVPEAVEVGLDVAINQMDWNPEAINRLMFLILDAPPHLTKEAIKKMQENIRLAAQKGIKIIPLSASGINKDTEYLMKTLAIATNSTYTFLTDDSGIGNPHLEVTADVYDVKYLNDLMVEIINRYLEFEDCPELENEEAPVISIVRQQNPDLIQYIECFPNPATDFVNVRLQESFDVLSIKNTLGQVVQEKRELEPGQTTIQLQGWAAGMYYLEFRKGEEYVIEKLVIQSEK